MRGGGIGWQLFLRAMNENLRIRDEPTGCYIGKMLSFSLVLRTPVVLSVAFAKLGRYATLARASKLQWKQCVWRSLRQARLALNADCCTFSRLGSANAHGHCLAAHWVEKTRRVLRV